jgi:hypothetical protein
MGRRPGDRADHYSFEVYANQRDEADVVPKASEERAIGHRNESQDNHLESDECEQPGSVRANHGVAYADHFLALVQREGHAECKKED